MEMHFYGLSILMPNIKKSIDEKQLYRFTYNNEKYVMTMT